MRYSSMADEFENHARRHEANAARHMAEGHPPHYAEGSLRKAARWRARKLYFEVPSILQPAYDLTLEALEQNLFEAVLTPRSE